MEANTVARWDAVMVPTPEPPQWAKDTASEILNYIKHHSEGHSDQLKERHIADYAVQFSKKRMTVDAAMATVRVVNFSFDKEKMQVVLDTPDRTYYANTAQHCLEQLERDIEASHTHAH